jgi:hypothetical protein
LQAPPFGSSASFRDREYNLAPVVGVGKVNSCGAHLVGLLTGTWGRVGDIDDVEDLWAAEAGDLDGTHAPEARGRR